MSESAPREAEATVDGRRSYVTIVFADLCDYTSLNEAVDPEETEGIRRELEEVALRVVHKHGGTVSQVYGDGILAVFGYPDPSEDDSRRAVDAALELHAATRTATWQSAVSAGFEVRLHSAVHAGLVFVRRGDALHGQYELTGDAVTTTARLCSAAERDEILVSDAVLSGIEGFFDTAAAQLIALKGKKAPVQAHRVIGRSEVRTRFEARSRAGLTALVGRELELTRLEGLPVAARSNGPRVALVTGAPGVGKTRILDEFRRRTASSGWRVLLGCCDSYGETAPLEPFSQTVRQLFGTDPSAPIESAASAVRDGVGRLGSSVEQYTETFLQLLSLRPWQAESRRADESPRVVHALSELLSTCCAREPLVLVLDDWQWADDASRKVLDHMLRDAARRPLCIVVGMREGTRVDPLLEDAEAFALRPFTEKESAAMIRTLRPRILDLGVARALHLRSGGNPLFLEELCRSLPDGVLAGERALEESGVPTTLQGVIQARVGNLPEAQARLLRAASVIGNEFSRVLLEQVLPEDAVATLLAELARGDLIHATDLAGTFRFKHGITREVIYESVRMGERREVHRSIAAAIAGAGAADQVEALAYHHRGSGEHAQAATYAELAGDKATLTSSLDRARLHYSAALGDLDKLPPSLEQKQRWLALSSKWAGVYVYSPSRHQLETLHKAARYAAEVGDTKAQAMAAHWSGWINYVLGEYGEAMECLRTGLSCLERAPDDRLLAQLWTTLGQAHAAAGEHDEAIECLTRGLDQKRARVRGAAPRTLPLGFAYAVGCRANICADRGDFEQAERDIEEAIGAVSGTGHAIEGSVRALASMVQIYRGEWQACVESAGACRAIAERVNSAYVFAMGTAFEAYGEFMLAGDPRALHRMSQAVEWLESRDTGLFISFNYGCLAEGLASALDARGARDYALRALLRRERRDPLGATMAYRALARVQALSGPEARRQVRELIEQATASAQQRGSRRDLALTRLAFAELRAEASAGVEARAAAREVLPELERMGMRWHAQRARKLLGLSATSAGGA